MNGRKKLLLALGITAGILVCIYCGVSIYFINHFYHGTKIVDVDFSMKTADEADAYFAKQIDTYSLAVSPKEGAKENITGSEISMKYKRTGGLEKALKDQSAFLWPSMFWKKQDIQMEMEFDYDQKQLVDRIQSLKSFQNEDKSDPVGAKPEFDGNKFVVKPEVLGTKVDQEVMQEKITGAIDGLKDTLDMDKEECYLKPKYTSESKEVAAARDALNDYCRASIIYDMPPQQEVVDKQLISTWLSWDENMNVTFHEDQVREYMNQFAAKYETLYGTRPLTTPWGKATEVSGGTYGWAIDEAAEAEVLIASIKNGDIVTKEPPYIQRAAVHEAQDWGKTFIEVDLSEQYMWYIVDGNVVLETAVVTGKPYSHSTPPGVYDILWTTTSTFLIGNILPETGEPEYRTYVDYWMPVTYSGIGFHDATWQAAFGGDLYWSNGSHGCINMPLDSAAALYNMIAAGTPVVMHY
ncbi:MAG: L,D-transpeptidase/peptidoglycan binding protein [Ruminococcus sp.]|nr:L,D-transpeptidase/peptidoglycan binding protein [Ruminococcus sp.]